jgi:ribosomal protein L37E
MSERCDRCGGHLYNGKCAHFCGFPPEERLRRARERDQMLAADRRLVLRSESARKGWGDRRQRRPGNPLLYRNPDLVGDERDVADPLGWVGLEAP